jgi:hypothetical protein
MHRSFFAGIQWAERCGVDEKQAAEKATEALYTNPEVIAVDQHSTEKTGGLKPSSAQDLRFLFSLPVKWSSL